MLLLLSTAAFPSFAEDAATSEVAVTDQQEALQQPVEKESDNAPLSTDANQDQIEENTGADEEQIETPPVDEPADEVVREPFLGTSIEDTQGRLKTLYSLFEESSETQKLLAGLVLAESDDRVFRRNCEFLLRVCSNQVFTGHAAMTVFPRLIRTAAAIEQKRLEEVMKLFNEDFNRDSATRLNLIENLKQLNSLGSKIHELGVKISARLKENLAHSLLLSGRRHHSSEIAGFLRKRNRLLTESIMSQLKGFDGLLNQLNHHVCLHNNIIAHISDANNELGGTLLAVRAARSLRSFRDFRHIQENYQTSLETSQIKFAGLIKSLQEQTETFCRSHRRDYVKIQTLSGNFPVRDADLAETPVLELHDFLDEKIRLLSELRAAAAPTEKKEDVENGIVSLTSEELENLWSIFLKSESWHNSELFTDYQTKEDELAD